MRKKIETKFLPPRGDEKWVEKRRAQQEFPHKIVFEMSIYAQSLQSPRCHQTLLHTGEAFRNA